MGVPWLRQVLINLYAVVWQTLMPQIFLIGNEQEIVDPALMSSDSMSVASFA